MRVRHTQPILTVRTNPFKWLGSHYITAGGWCLGRSGHGCGSYAQMVTRIKRWRERTGGKRSAVYLRFEVMDKYSIITSPSSCCWWVVTDLKQTWVVNIPADICSMPGKSHKVLWCTVRCYLLISPVLWLEITARLFKLQVEMRKPVEEVHPPRRRVADHSCHVEETSTGSSQRASEDAWKL